jgi:putative transposase
MRGDWNVSIRRACHVFLLDRSTYHYRTRRPAQAALEQRIKEVCQTRVCHGYRRIHVLLRREGWSHGQNKTRRTYRELSLQLRNKTPKRRVKATLRGQRFGQTRLGRWTSCTISWPRRKAAGCCRSSTLSRVSRRRLSRGSTTAAPMSLRRWKESGERWGCRKAFASTRVPSLCHATWISSRSTFCGQEAGGQCIH